MPKDLALKLRRIIRGLHDWFEDDDEEEGGKPFGWADSPKHFDEEIFGDYFTDKKKSPKRDFFKEDRREQERYEKYWKQREREKPEDLEERTKRWEQAMLQRFKNDLNWVEPNKLAFGPAPDQSELKWLEEQGFNVLISFLENFQPAHYTEFGFELYHFPIEDFDGPNIQHLDNIIKTIQSLLAKGKKIYAHCFSGQGRSGTIIAAYYINKGLDYKAAIAKVRTIEPKAVESSLQVEALKDYEKYIKMKTSMKGTAEEDYGNSPRV